MKAFDTVEMMRTARAAISVMIASMSLEEQNEWLHSNPPTDPTLRHLFTRAAQQRAAAAAAQRRG